MMVVDGILVTLRPPKKVADHFEKHPDATAYEYPVEDRTGGCRRCMWKRHATVLARDASSKPVQVWLYFTSERDWYAYQARGGPSELRDMQYK